MHEITDEELAERWQTGDMEAYEELYNRHWGRTVTRAFAVLCDSGDAQDVAQEVWAKFAIRPCLWSRQLGRFRPWIEKCATNKAIERLRPKIRRRTEPAEHLESLCIPDPSDISEEVAIALDREKLRQTIRNCFQLLDVSHRQILIYAYYEMLSIREISQRLSDLEGRRVPIGTVNSRLNRAREQLRAHVRRYGYPIDEGNNDDQ